jgi:hypothetical protein
MKPRVDIPPRPRRRVWALIALALAMAAPLAARPGRTAAGKSSARDERAVVVAKLAATTNHGFADSGAMPPREGLESTWADARLAFSGRSLMYECGASDRGFVGDVWSQSALLSTFAGGADFFPQAVASAEETDWAGLYRPGPDHGPVLADFRSRLGVGSRIDSPAAQGKVWLLNHVRFRRDQIKLNYELLVFEAGVDPTIEYAAFIHSVLIPPGLQAAYQDAVLALETDEERLRRTTVGPDDVGCALRSLLNTWIPQGRYFFLHANVFDRSTGGMDGEWVFAEFKPARLHLLSAPDRPQPVVFDSVPAGGVPGEALELRVAPMSFQRFRKQGRHLVPIAGDQVVLWKSTNVADRFIELVEGEDGLPVPKDDVVFNNPQAYTCVQCHDAAFGVARSDEDPSLPPVQKNHFRHVAWGLSQPFGLHRWGGARTSDWYEGLLRQRTELEAGRIVNP